MLYQRECLHLYEADSVVDLPDCLAGLWFQLRAHTQLHFFLENLRFPTGFLLYLLEDTCEPKQNFT